MTRLLAAIGLILTLSATAHAQQDVQARMRAWATALGVECAHCHVVEAWTDGSKPAYAFAQRMQRMLTALNAGPLKDVDPITCWTCHRGQTRPARLATAAWQSMRDRHVGEFANPESALAMSVYAASLGVECSHCHEPGSFTAPTKPAYGMLAKMLPIFDEIPKHFDAARMPRTQCYLCHQGQRIPQRRPR